MLLSAYVAHKHSETFFSREIGFSASCLFRFRLLSDPEKLSKSVMGEATSNFVVAPSK